MKKPLPLFITLLFLSICTILFAQDQPEKNYELLLSTGTISPEPNIHLLEDLEIQEDEIVLNRIYRIVQFEEIPSGEIKEDLKNNGIILLNYLPNLAYFASLDQDVKINVLQEERFRIRGIYKLEVHQKIDPSLKDGFIPDWVVEVPGKADLIVNYFEGISENQARELFRNEPGVEIMDIDGKAYFAKIRIQVEFIEKIASLPFVSFVEPVDPPPTEENMTGRTLHRSNTLNNKIPGGLRYDGTGVIVTMGESGGPYSHIDLSGRLSNGNTTGITSHATHVAGTLLGAGNIDPLAQGQAPGAEIISFTNHTDISTSSTISGLYNTQLVRVTNHSIGQTCNAGYNNSARLADLHVGNLPGLFNVFSAGNSGVEDCDYGAGAGWGNITGGYKAAKNAITVGNLSRIDVISSSSSRGPTADGRIKPDICAKGTSVYSTYPDNEYNSISGTSMASPGVAGCIAQLIQAFRTMNGGQDPKLGLLKGVLLNTADDLGNPGPDYIYGWGRINVWRAYNILKDFQYFSASVSHNNSNNHSITVPTGTKELRVMVYWADPAAASGVSKALINDLDITLTTPSNQVLEPWTLSILPNATELNKPAERGKDRRNNMEQVTLLNPASGTYILNVAGFQVPQGPQEYFVSYEFVQDEITVLFPIGGENLVPGETEYIRWDAFGSSGSFKVEYSLNNGNTWTTLSTSVQGTRRYYAWNVPNVLTGEALIRVSRNNLSGSSESVFSIIGVPDNLEIDWRCQDTFRLSWDEVTGATAYEVFLLGNKYMDSQGVTSSTNFTVYGNNSSTRWVSVQALADSGKTSGRRAYAIEVPNNIFGCSSFVPVADFTTPDTTSCNGIVNFSDNSQNNPSVWLWDFGDGKTSTMQNPVHYYENPGTYTVTLTTTNSSGSDQKEKTSYINIPQNIDPPATTDDTHCGPGQVFLKASGANTIKWFDVLTGGTVLHTGNNYSTELSQTTTFFVKSSTYKTSDAVQKIGPQNNSIGTGGFFTSSDLRGLVFDVFSPVKIKSVYVYANSSENRTIEVLDAVGGKVLQSKTLFISSGGSRINLDFVLNPGSNYHIKCIGTVNLYRNSSGTNFPYSINNLISVTRTDLASNPTGFYYYFYDWEVQEIGCESEFEPVTGNIEDCTGIEAYTDQGNNINVYPNPSGGIFETSFNLQKDEMLSIEIFNLTGQKIYSWQSEAAGNYSRQINISDAPPGIYTMKIRAGDFLKHQKIVKR